MIQLLKAVRILADAGVDFIIVGGVAVRSHGSSYVTEDLDVCYSRGKDNLARLAEALLPFKPRPRNFPEGLPFSKVLTLRLEQHFAISIYSVR